MTRKRFKKLLMAQGISRNGAEALAYHVKARKCRSYEKMFRDTMRARNAVGTMAEAAGRVIAAFEEFVTAFFETLRPAIEIASRVVREIAQAVEVYEDGTNQDKQLPENVRKLQLLESSAIQKLDSG